MEAPALPKPQLATLLLHADTPDVAKEPTHPVAPPISMSTTFRQPHPDSELGKGVDQTYDAPEQPSMHIYSRYTQETGLRAEHVLTDLLGGRALTFGSGLAASLAVLTVLAPSVIALRRGYFGMHCVVEMYARGRSVQVVDLDDDVPVNEGELDEATGIRHGATLLWVETPLNPTGEARDLDYYAKKAHDAKAYIAVDATFAPPPLQQPFAHGVDIVLHSATKYLGGHTDVLAGVVASQDYAVYKALWDDRAVHGAVLGSLESYLLLRSLRTFKLRILQQSKTAGELVAWLHTLTEGQQAAPGTPAELTNGQVVQRVYHSTLQPRQDQATDTYAHNARERVTFDPAQQMPIGGSPTFALLLNKEVWAKYMPHALAYFTPATSLGGVESLIEQRVLSTPDEDPRLLRISVGIEDAADLKADLTRSMLRTLQEHP